MVKPIPAKKLAALRALREGAVPSYELLAAAGGVYITSLKRRALLDGWEKVDYRTNPARAARAMLNTVARDRAAWADDAAFDLPLQVAGGRTDPAGAVEVGGAEQDVPEQGTEPDQAELVARMSGFVGRQLGRLIATADRHGGRLDKGQIDGLVALSRVVERWDALAADQARVNNEKSEEDLAEAFDRIDRRIIELARELAGVMVAEELERRQCAAGGGGMVQQGAAGAVSAGPAAQARGGA